MSKTGTILDCDNCITPLQGDWIILWQEKSNDGTVTAIEITHFKCQNKEFDCSLRREFAQSIVWGYRYFEDKRFLHPDRKDRVMYFYAATMFKSAENDS